MNKPPLEDADWCEVCGGGPVRCWVDDYDIIYLCDRCEKALNEAWDAMSDEEKKRTIDAQT